MWTISFEGIIIGSSIDGNKSIKRKWRSPEQTNMRSIVAIVETSMHAIVLKQEDEKVIRSIRALDCTVSRIEETLAII